MTEEVFDDNHLRDRVFGGDKQEDDQKTKAGNKSTTNTKSRPKSKTENKIVDNEEENDRKQITVYKYSGNLKDELHEAALIDNAPPTYLFLRVRA